MNKALRVIGIVALTAVIVVALWVARTRSARSSDRESLNDTIHSAITDPVAFAKARFTGGVGAMLRADSATGFPMVQQVVVGSPAEKAGLRMGDLIVQVDGIATTGRTLAQNVDSIRGFVGGSVTLTIQRNGSTNLQCVIHRSSWNSLGVTPTASSTVTATGAPPVFTVTATGGAPLTYQWQFGTNVPSATNR